MPAAGLVMGYDKALRKRIDSMLQTRASVAGGIYGVMMIIAAWVRGERLWPTVGFVAGYTLYATVMGKLVFGKTERLVPNLAFYFGNTVYAVGIMWCLNFEAPAFLTVPLMILFLDGFSDGENRYWTLGTLAALLIASLALGAPPVPAFTMVLVGWTVHWFSEGRAETLRVALADLREQAEVMQKVNAEMGDLYAKMVAQERLSSLGLMAAGVAHEINNPLAYVSSNVNALALDLDRLATDAELRAEYKTEIIPATIDGMSRVSAIISDLRRFARADPAKKAVFELDREVMTALRVCKTKIEDTCELEVELEQQLHLEGQSGQICQVLVNLITNATYAMRQKRGLLRLTAARVDSDIVLTVADQGAGMPQEVLNRIFEPFFTTKTRGEGTGLGLSVVHGIVRSHGGNIDVTSVVGKGTTFTVRLPATRVWAAPAQHRDGTNAAA